MRVKASLFLLIFVMMLSFSVDSVVGEEKASDFTLIDIDGNSFTLSECAARVVLIDFFGTYCGPCKDAIPTLRNLYNEYTRNQLEIISISPEDGDTLRIFAQQYNMEWIVASDPTGGVSNAYGITYIPRSFLIDADSYIRYDHTGWSGEPDASELRSRINSLLSGNGNDGNGDSDNNSGAEQTGPPYTLIVIIGGAVIVSLVVGIAVAGQLFEWSKPTKKRGKHKH